MLPQERTLRFTLLTKTLFISYQKREYALWQGMIVVSLRKETGKFSQLHT